MSKLSQLSSSCPSPGQCQISESQSKCSVSNVLTIFSLSNPLNWSLTRNWRLLVATNNQDMTGYLLLQCPLEINCWSFWFSYIRLKENILN